MAGPPCFTSPAFARLDGIRHGFFGREGGVSTGLYASLNAGPGSKDAPEAVAENRARIASRVGITPAHLVSLYQVHSPAAVRVDAPFTEPRPQADAMVSATPGLALGILTADCAPILFADEAAGVIGAAHAGWRGALGGVIEACAELMETCGASRKNIRAAIGPCIHQPSYEVGPDFKAAFAGAEAFFKPGRGDRLLFDLPGYCAMRLTAAGIAQIDVLPFDTYSEPQALFSHRSSVHQNEPDYGRNCAVIALSDRNDS
jgi:YfiH family protein